MTSDVWVIGQQQSAQDLYNSIGVATNQGKAVESEVEKVREFTRVCHDMLNSYDNVVKDQNEYQIEIDNTTDELNNLNEDLKAKIEQLQKEIDELKQKEANGTITEDELTELKNKEGKLDVLIKNGNNDIENKGTTLAQEVNDFNSDNRTKEVIANEYGQLAIDKGIPLTNTGSGASVGNVLLFYGTVGLYQLFGGGGLSDEEKECREVGRLAIDTGTELIEKVEFSSQLGSELAEGVAGIGKEYGSTGAIIAATEAEHNDNKGKIKTGKSYR